MDFEVYQKSTGIQEGVIKLGPNLESVRYERTIKCTYLRVRFPLGSPQQAELFTAQLQTLQRRELAQQAAQRAAQTHALPLPQPQPQMQPQPVTQQPTPHTGPHIMSIMPSGQPAPAQMYMQPRPHQQPPIHSAPAPAGVAPVPPSHPVHNFPGATQPHFGPQVHPRDHQPVSIYYLVTTNIVQHMGEMQPTPVTVHPQAHAPGQLHPTSVHPQSTALHVHQPVNSRYFYF